MLALDTSSIIAYLAGDSGRDVEAVETALRFKQAVLPPVVLCELLSDPKLPESVARAIGDFPVLVLQPGVWERAGLLRAKVIARGRQARLADALIAQSCLDHDLPLVTRDREFSHFATLSSLKLKESL